jgi:hypothetical protein
MKVFSVRQGDVLLVDADYRGVKDGELVQPTERGNVLAHGEVTGHAHVIERQKAAIYDVAGERFVQIIENLAPLIHEEHGHIPLDRAALVNPVSGRLQQAFQVEEQGEEIRRVQD